eukprot:g25311.t1
MEAPFEGPEKPRLQSVLRGVMYKLYLGAAKQTAGAKEFVACLQTDRQEYAKLRAKYVDMKVESELALTPEDAEDSWRYNQWTRSFPKGMPVLETLRRDIERTYSEESYFREQETRKTMERILYIWLTEEDLNSPEGQHLLYRQGMNELLAVLMIALNTDRLSRESAQAKLPVSDTSSPLPSDKEQQAETITSTTEEHLKVHKA